MSVENSTQRHVYQGDGSTTEFDIDFKILDISHLYAAKKNTLTGVVTVLDLTTNYTVTLDEDEGASLTMLVAPTANEKLYIYPDAPETQLLEIDPLYDFPEEDIETALDKLTILVKQISEKVSRSLKFPRTSDSYDIEPTLPEPDAGKALKWNDDENGFENSEQDIDEVVTLAQGYATTASTQAASATASATAAGNSATAAASSATDAQTAQDGAETAQTAAEAAETAAETAQAAAETAQTASETAQTAAEAAAQDAADTLAQGIPSSYFTVNAGASDQNFTGETLNPATFSSCEYLAELNDGANVFGHLPFSAFYNGAAWVVVVGIYRSLGSQTDHKITFDFATNQLIVSNAGANNVDIAIKKNAFALPSP